MFNGDKLYIWHPASGVEIGMFCNDKAKTIAIGALNRQVGQNHDIYVAGK